MPADWERSDRGSLQGVDQATVLQIGFPLERGRRVGSLIDPLPEANTRALERLLEAYLPIRVHKSVCIIQ